MKRKIYLAAFLLGAVLGAPAADALAQTSGNSAQASEIAALFNKTKHKVKEKHGVRIEVFVDIKSEPVVKNAVEYSGVYQSDMENSIELRAGADGRVEASGSEPSPTGTRRFTLKDARIEGALLTGTKVYEDGATEKFEGVFLNRTVRTGRNDAGTNIFGLGVRFNPPKTLSDDNFELNKLFYERK